MRTVMILAIPAAIAAFVASCFFVVDQTEYAIQMRFGDPVRTLIEPGLQFGLRHKQLPSRDN